ncbi:MAG: gamma-glutamyl-gamma-aminobutyrate hydrolase family protein [Candidatus Micrarchaeota archaeon]
MQLLVVNNHSKHLAELIDKLENIELVDFRKLGKINRNSFDAVILSGGSSLCVEGHDKQYSAEINLIKTCNKPILGICLGFELISHAYGEELQLLNHKAKGTFDITITARDALFEKLPEKFKVFESHRWVVPKTTALVTLAKSKNGVEAVKHPTKLIYGVQFHPEVLVEKSHAELILNNFIQLVPG